MSRWFRWSGWSGVGVVRLVREVSVIGVVGVDGPQVLLEVLADLEIFFSYMLHFVQNQFFGISTQPNATVSKQANRITK